MLCFRKPQPRYRLRTLLGGVTLTCLLLTALPYEARQYHQHKARARGHIVSLGGIVETAGHIERPSPGANWLSKKLGYIEARESLWSVNLSGAPLSAHDVEKLSACDWIVALNVSNTNIDDDALEPVARLENLRTLRLANTPITDKGLIQLKPLSRLQVLDVADTAATYDCLAELEQAIPGTNFQEQYAISRLKSVGVVIDLGIAVPRYNPHYSRFPGSAVADVRRQLDRLTTLHSDPPPAAGSIHLTRSVRLTAREDEDLRRLVSATSLKASDVVFPIKGLEFVSELKHLQSVSIDEGEIGNLRDNDLRWLEESPRLTCVELRSPNFTGASVAHLSRAPALTSLTLDGDGLTDADLAHLARMHQLQHLSLQGNNLTPALISHLRGLAGLRRLELNLWLRGTRPLERPPEGVIAAAYESMKYHAEIPNLKQVSYTGNLIAAELLAPLTELTALEWLRVDGRFVSHEEARALQIAMPHCHVQRVDFD